MDQKEKDVFFSDDICSVCSSTKKLYCRHPRLGWYEWICPKCNESEYYRKWPTSEAIEILGRLEAEAKAARRKLDDFSRVYEKNPKKALELYSKLKGCL